MDQPGKSRTKIAGDVHGSVYSGNIGQIGDRHIDTRGGSYIEKYIGSPSSDDERRLYNRQVMLKGVYDFWIKGVLQDSLHQNLLIDLHLEDKPGAVNYCPWDMVVRQPKKKEHLLPPGTTILKIFELMDSRLLILGEPGSGKTTMLLELVKQLIEGRQHSMKPIPVVFNLSSWAERQLPLEEWLVDELSRNYNVSKNQGRNWIKNDALSLFLDGLDEVMTEVRELCVQAINAFRERRASVALCVCCRRQEYEELPTKLTLNGAVLLQPLTRVQVETYLDKLGPGVNGVRVALKQDSSLQEISESPLMLNILLMTFKGKEADTIVLGDNPKQQYQTLFRAYVHAMFQRHVRTTNSLYSSSDTIHWLSWLAYCMIRHSQTLFLVERIQPSWVQPHLDRPNALVSTFMLTWGLIYGAVGGLVYLILNFFYVSLIDIPTLFVNNEMLTIPFDQQMTGIMFTGLGIGLFGGLFDGIVGGYNQIRQSSQGSTWRNRMKGNSYALYWGLVGLLLFGAMASLSGGLSFGLVTGLVIGLQLGLIGGVVGTFRDLKLVKHSDITWQLRITELLLSTFWGLSFGLIVGLSMGVLAGLTVGLMFWLICMIGERSVIRKSKTNKLQSLSRKQAKRNVVTGLQNGLAIGLLYAVWTWLAFWLIPWDHIIPLLELSVVLNVEVDTIIYLWIIIVVIFYVIFGGGFGLIGGLLFEPSKKPQIEQVVLTYIPNQGIRLAMENALFFALLFASISGLINGLFSGSLISAYFDLTTALLLGLLAVVNGAIFGGLVGGMIGGVDIVIKHYLLRLVLWQQNYIPRDYVHFLDYAVERIFLRKVGGGYIFVHRLLMEYFAEVYEKEIQNHSYASSITQLQ